MNGERVLVVDDEPAMLRSVERVLEGRYRVATARSSREALESAGKERPDLAIVDIRMPELDGFQLVGKMRELDPGLDVIFMTGLVAELDSNLIRAIREKAFYFIQKPFDREVLLTLVGRCLEVRRLQAQNREYTARLEAELSAARSFQRSLLPVLHRRIDGLVVDARYVPCDDLGGDLVDWERAGQGSLTVLVADVSGHGVGAAMLTGVVKSAFHDNRKNHFLPADVVRRVSDAIGIFDEARFVTLFCARLDRKRGQLAFVNAGHPPAVLWGPERERTLLARTGPLVSPAHPEADWAQREIELRVGDRLLLYTDGISEARGEEGGYGAARLLALLEAAPLDGGALLDTILADVERHSAGRPADDDRTLLTVRVD